MPTPAGADEASEARTWTEALAPIIRRFKVAASLPGTAASWNSTGAAALAKLLAEMAHRLDVVAPDEIGRLQQALDEKSRLIDRAADIIRRQVEERDRLREEIGRLNAELERRDRQIEHVSGAVRRALDRRPAVPQESGESAS